MDRILAPLALVAILAGCASAPPGPQGTVEISRIRVRYIAPEQVSPTCAARMRDSKYHTACATYNRMLDTCDIVAVAPAHKLDWDRMAVVGIELNNCLDMKRERLGTS